MSLMVTCPTCQATLRVPVGAETIRCPQCKTILTVQTPEAEAPAPAKPAIPLPFARPAPAAPAEPEYDEPDPAPLPRGKRIRAKVVEEQDDEPDDRPRKKKPYISETEQKEQAKRERFEQEAGPTKLGLLFLGYGSLAAIIAPIGITLYFLSTLYFTGDKNALAYVPFVGLGLHWLLCFIGFLCCFFGPRDVRHLALYGALAILIHIGATFALVWYTNIHVNRAVCGFGELNREEGIISSLFFANQTSNLVSIMNLPLVIFLHSGSMNAGTFALLFFAAGLEFTKLSLIGILANHYAAEGKDPELGHLSLRFVYRIIWVVIVGLACQGLIIGGSKLGFGSSFLSLPALMVINAYHLWCSFAWVAEFQVIEQVREVIRPERFLSTQARLEHY
jgi:LSD1 subclass zinc finger protein